MKLVFSLLMRYSELQDSIMTGPIRENKKRDNAYKMSGGKIQPLAGKRILITRAREQVEEFSRLLEGYGAQVIAFPTIEIAPPEDWGPLDRVIEGLDTYDWIIFTSVNGVRFFTQRLKEKSMSVAVIAGKKICAIGPRTKRELENMGLPVAYIPQEYRAEAVADGLRDRGIQGNKILMPRARGARRVLPDALREAGGAVDEVEAYRVVMPPEGKDALVGTLRKGIDLVVFTSSSTVRNFMEILSERGLVNGVEVSVIGPVTGETVRRYGLKPTVMPPEYTIPALVDAIVDYFKKLVK